MIYGTSYDGQIADMLRHSKTFHDLFEKGLVKEAFEDFRPPRS